MMVKVKEINLERGNPTADMAVRNMINQMSTCKAQGYKAAILIHGYGSSGVGGAIKISVRSKLKESSLSGMVRRYCGGESWQEHKREFVDLCPQLKDFSSRIEGNSGLTVVLFK